MVEIKLRLDAIQDSIATAKAEQRAEDPPIDSFLRVEFAILQVRYVCELVALATLAANQPLGLGKQLREDWNAGKILKTLSKLNPHCFPQHAKFSWENEAWNIVADKGLEAEDLRRIYDKCGAMLHRGTIQRAFDGKSQHYNIGQVEKWAKDIGAHLSTHVARIPSKKIMLVVSLPDGEGNMGQVAQCAMGSHSPSPARPVSIDPGPSPG